MPKTDFKQKLKKRLPVAIVFLSVVFFWQLTDLILDTKEIILPTPQEIFLVSLQNFGTLVNETLITAFESVTGFILGSFLALLIAIWFTYSSTSKKAIYPYPIALKATPLYALAPLLTLWFGSGLLSKIVMSSMVAFFPVLVSAVDGFNAVNQDELDLMKILKASKRQIFFKLRLPKSLPFIFPSLKIATTLAVVGATIAEFTGSSRGVGHLIVNSSYYLETSLMFAGIVMVSLIGIALFGLVALIEKRVIFWK